MEAIFLVVHLLIASALVAVILLQRSEGGALGIGGGGGGGMLSSRGAANALTRTTSILAIGFFCTSVLLTLLAQQSRQGPISVIESTPGSTPSGTQGLPDDVVPPPAAPVVPDGEDALAPQSTSASEASGADEGTGEIPAPGDGSGERSDAAAPAPDIPTPDAPADAPVPPTPER